MKYPLIYRANCRGLSLPVRGAWIEISSPVFCIACCASLPVRGAWIEIQIVSEVGKNDVVSLPVRGAWIEIVLVSRLMSGTWSSLPVRGAWIEISSTRPRVISV